MKQGRTLTELASELERRSEAKRDLVADCRSLALTCVESTKPTEENEAPKLTTRLSVNDEETFNLTPHTHRQIGTYLGIPAKYYERMHEQAPWLLAGNVNHWLKENPKRRMVRTLDGEARAFMSDRYRRFDNERVAEAVIPVLLDAPDNAIQLASAEVTERKLYIKAVFPQIEQEVKRGDIVQAGIEISNSEIGLGSVSVLPFIYRLICLNGMTMADRGMRRYHIGKQIEGEGQDVYEMFRDETLQADDKALIMKLQDIVRAAMTGENGFSEYVQGLRDAQDGTQIANPIKAVEQLAETVVLSQPEQVSVLTHLLREGDMSRFGMLNAVTRTAVDVESYDRASELEKTGGKILNIPKDDWERIAVAA